METKLHWIDGPWPGKLALSARPRGGEWLEEEIAVWRRSGVDIVLSLLTAEEEHDLDIADERAESMAKSINFISFPIPDREVPASEAGFNQLIEQIDRDLAGSRNVVVHCRQGVGRTGLVAACLLLKHGIDPETAVQKLSAARGTAVPETEQQRRWIDHYAERFAVAP